MNVKVPSSTRSTSCRTTKQDASVCIQTNTLSYNSDNAFYREQKTTVEIMILSEDLCILNTRAGVKLSKVYLILIP